MQIKLPDLNQIADKFLLGFFAFFGWALAAFVNTKIPWPS